MIARAFGVVLGGILLSFSSKAAEAASASSTPWVFIHGIKGSRLVDSEGNLKWISGAQALGLSTPALALPLAWQSEQLRDELHVDGILEKVSIIPYLLESDVYGSWIKAAKASGHPFYSFAYDWRRDNNETLELFRKYLEKVIADAGGAKVRVIGHSMGGMISLALLYEHPELFDSIIFVGSPLRGGVGFLPDLHRGEAEGLNRKITSPEVLFSFPSVYSFLPFDGRGLVAPDGKALAMDFYSVDDWRTQKLGIFAVDEPSLTRKPKENFLKIALAKAKEFRAKLSTVPIAFPRILVINSRAHPTLSEVQSLGPKSVRGWDFENRPKVPGDGRVTEEESLPPQGVPYTVFQSQKSHGDLLNDPLVIQKIRDF